jgi:hypothetical protein
MGCKFCPEEVKQRAREYKGVSIDDDKETASPVVRVGANKRARSGSGVPSATKDSQKQAKFKVVSAKAHSFPPMKQVAWENQLLRAFISAGWSFNSITDPEVQKLFHDFIPGASVPTHQKLSNQILVREMTRMESSLKVSVQGAYATIQQDGWKPLSKKHLVAFMYTANREVIIQSTITSREIQAEITIRHTLPTYMTCQRSERPG